MWGTGAFQRPWTEALGLGGIVKQSKLAMEAQPLHLVRGLVEAWTYNMLCPLASSI